MALLKPQEKESRRDTKFDKKPINKKKSTLDAIQEQLSDKKERNGQLAK